MRSTTVEEIESKWTMLTAFSDLKGSIGTVVIPNGVIFGELDNMPFLKICLRTAGDRPSTGRALLTLQQQEPKHNAQHGSACQRYSASATNIVWGELRRIKIKLLTIQSHLPQEKKVVIGFVPNPITKQGDRFLLILQVRLKSSVST